MSTFSKIELGRIRTAIEKLEETFPIEVIPVFTKKSASYGMARFKALVIGIITSFVVMYLAYEYSSLAWAPLYYLFLLGIVSVLLVSGFVLLIPPIHRLLIGKKELHKVTFERAKNEYIDQKVASNPERIGILIFISFFEHRFHILYDKKASAFFDDSEWRTIVQNLSSMMKNSSPSDALEYCMVEIEEVLKGKIPKKDELPPSMLPNELRFE